MEKDVRVLAANESAIAEAIEILRRGGLVAIPTETVYGLAAHALDAAAVARIYEAKGRPANNPLIVHVASLEQARSLSSAWPDEAEALAARFWPGPLTIVVPRASTVPDIVTAGGSTVAVRVPSHPVARALADALPLAAPSANRSNMISPTTAEHVAKGLGDRVDLILDAGPTTAGIESTVVHATERRLLRPGTITVAELESVMGPLAPLAHGGHDAILPSPGMTARHYAPRAPLEVVEDDVSRVGELRARGVVVAWIGFDASADVVMPRDAAAYASRLYAALHAVDGTVDRIVVAAVPPDAAWLGVRDRLSRASRSG